MEIVSIPNVLYNPTDRISPYLMGKAGAANPSGDDGTLETLRAQRFNYRSQIAELDRIDADVYAEEISNLSERLRTVDDKIKEVASVHAFGEAYSVSISPEAQAMYGLADDKALTAQQDKML
ncbi:hypothetical protein SAMN02910356_00867 [Selenomonas sp. GACV-9]|uniref:hypothetical protein n=1 Tax=Selenomonas sp. GACV-9 TaxID=3158782 RepID=UPI0008F18614|nr:hypothetical protein SAMN02910356_00867 [Selenomonas ruminantium]